MDWLAFGMIAVSIALVVFILCQRIRDQQNVETVDIQSPPSDAFGPLTDPIANLIPHTQKKRDDLRDELVNAGYYYANNLKNFLAWRNVATMLIVLTFGVLLAAGLFETRHERTVIIVGLTLTIFSYSLPRLILTAAANKRKRQIENSLPDALDMIAMSVEGGFPIHKAIARVAVEFQPTHAILSKELNIISRQTKTGTLQQAMTSFGSRFDSPEIATWSALMAQSQRLGGRMVDSMVECADRMRENRKLRAEQAGNTVSAKLLLPVVLCIAPPIFMLLIGPAILEFRDFVTREREDSTNLVEQANSQTPVSNNPNGRPTNQRTTNSRQTVSDRQTAPNSRATTTRTPRSAGRQNSTDRRGSATR